MKSVAVTGGAGQIAYSLLFRIASGELLKGEEIALHILEVPQGEKALQGVVMELEDCAFPRLKEIIVGSDPYEVFKDVDYAFLVGAKPRGPGMERGDLLLDNGKIFVEQGKALNASAKEGVITLVVGNPCNTNCLIARSYAKRIRPENFYAMTWLDQNRAKSAIANKAGVDTTNVEDVVIWGNHSATQVPDFTKIKIGSGLAIDQLDTNWLQEEFLEGVQKRGAKVIEARGKSSAASAANAALEAMQALIYPSDGVFSMGIFSKGNAHQVGEGLIFSFPCRHETGVCIANDFSLDERLREKIKATEKELLEEKKMVEHLLNEESS